MSDIAFPFISDTVPFWAVGVFGVLGPLAVIIFVELFNAKLFPWSYTEEPRETRLRRLQISFFHSVSLFAFGISIILLLTEIGKKWIGRLRPHFLSVCNPTVGTLNCFTNTATGGILNAINTGGSFCTGNAKDVEEARLSFPSGHASFSTYTMLYLILYLEARLFALKFRYLKTLIQMSAFIAAYVTSISRISDYHHRGSDVIGGALLGGAVALFVALVLGKVLWIIDKSEAVYDYDFKSGNQPAPVQAYAPNPAIYPNNQYPNLNYSYPYN